MKWFLRSIFLFGASFICIHLRAQNIALGKKYTESPLQNYPYTAPPADTQLLTDGNFTKGFFWTSPTTVGWQFANKVTIDIDLGKVALIGMVTFNTVRSSRSGIYFPKNIFVFLSNNNKDFTYAGDAAIDTGNAPGEYKIKKFNLNHIYRSGRFVKLVIVPDGPLVLCDEIEVFKSVATSIQPPLNIITENHFNESLDSIESLDYQRRNLLEQLKRSSVGSPTSSLLSKITDELNDTHVSPSGLKNIESSIYLTHAQTLQSKYSKPFVVENFNPWGDLSPIHTPVSPDQLLSYKFLMLNKGVQYGAFVLTNIKMTGSQFNFKILNPDTSLISIELYKVKFVPTEDYTVTPDVLLPVSHTDSVSLGRSDLFIFKVTASRVGSVQSKINITAGGESISLIVNSEISGLSPNYHENLNAINWGYLFWNMIKNRTAEAVKDMDSHGINTVVVPPTYIPVPGDTDFSHLVKYLSNFSNEKKIFLLTNYESPSNRALNKNISFMSDEWKVLFNRWYEALVRAVNVAGFGNRELFIYPYDEVRGQWISEFRRFAIWVKKAIPDIKIYATLNSKNAVDSMIQFVDVAQILDNDSLKLFSQLPPHHCDIWIYKTEGFARSLSPYKYYRLMPWIAFANNIKGVGFWNYADVGKNGLLNILPNISLDSRFDYAVIYNDKDCNILSSRRWEAFRLGMEDYKVLCLYAKKFGLKDAINYAEIVLNNPQESNLADSIRVKMISSLIR